MEKTTQYNVIFRPEPEGGFTVIVPSLSGCVTYGKDLEEQTLVSEYNSTVEKEIEKNPITIATLPVSTRLFHLKKNQ